MRGRTDYPYEEFVVGAVEAWLKTNGYADVTRSRSGYQDPDLLAEGEVGRFVIEAKGHTSAISTDFNTGFGQIVKHMTSRQARYALALPDTDKYRYQISLVPERVRTALSLWWLLVGADGSVEEIPPAAGAEHQWAHADLRSELSRFEDELAGADLKQPSIDTYVKGGETFLRWLVGDYTPQGPTL